MKNKTAFYADVERHCKPKSMEWDDICAHLWEARKQAILLGLPGLADTINVSLRIRFNSMKPTGAGGDTASKAERV